jgi:hypothetical protein
MTLLQLALILGTLGVSLLEWPTSKTASSSRVAGTELGVKPNMGRTIWSRAAYGLVKMEHKFEIANFFRLGILHYSKDRMPFVALRRSLKVMRVAAEYEKQANTLGVIWICQKSVQNRVQNR